uniref:GTP-binding protein Rhes n=2 Tax=Parascaris TaxID=6254 RepID=A0A914ZX34_PARUN
MEERDNRESSIISEFKDDLKLLPQKCKSETVSHLMVEAGKIETFDRPIASDCQKSPFTRSNSKRSGGCFQLVKGYPPSDILSRAFGRQAVAKRLERSSSKARSVGTGRGRTHSTVPNIRSQEYTLTVLGASKVGKTALVGQFLWDGFITEYHPTVEEFNWIEYNNDFGNELLLQVIDTSGSHDFLAMRHLYARTGDAFIVVFAADDPESFEEAKRIVEEIRERNIKKAPILLLGNKSDLYESEADWPCKDINSFVSAHLILYAPVSAKNAHRVEQVFGELLDQMHGFHPSAMKKRRQSMPSGRAYSGVDVSEIERIAKKHTRSICVIS